MKNTNNSEDVSINTIKTNSNKNIYNLNDTNKENVIHDYFNIEKSKQQHKDIKINKKSINKVLSINSSNNDNNANNSFKKSVLLNANPNFKNINYNNKINNLNKTDKINFNVESKVKSIFSSKINKENVSFNNNSKQNLIIFDNLEENIH